MKNTSAVASKMQIIPRLKLAVKKAGGGVDSTGPHLVKFVSDKLVDVPDKETGKIIQAIRYIVEEKGIQYRWDIPLYSKTSTKENLIPDYRIEQLMSVQEGDEVILEMKRSGIKNYVDIKIAKGSHVEEEEIETEAEVERQLKREEQ